MKEEIVHNTLNAGTKKRFILFDSMRGFFALMVVLFHFTKGSPFFSLLSEAMQTGFSYAFYLGMLDVELFYVLSGFLIAYTLRKIEITPRFFGFYMLKRSLRLEPVYWLSIVIVLTYLALSIWLRPGFSEELPSLGSLVAHGLYLQSILGYEHLSVLYWTLCIEAQFYVLFALYLWLMQRCQGLGADARPTRGIWGVLWISLYLAALFQAYTNYLNLAHRTWLIDFWPYFFLGISGWWAASGRMNRGVFLLCLAAIIPFEVFLWSKIRFFTSVCTVLIYFGVYHGFAFRIHLGKSMIFLGKISYSLYLIHGVIGMRVLNLFWRLPLFNQSQWGALAAISIALGISIFAAWISFHLVELPGYKLAYWMQHRSGSPPLVDGAAIKRI